MSDVADQVAQEIAEILVERGWTTCLVEDVREVAMTGSVEPSNVGDDYDDALTEAITDQLDKRGIEIG